MKRRDFLAGACAVAMSAGLPASAATSRRKVGGIRRVDAALDGFQRQSTHGPVLGGGVPGADAAARLLDWLAFEKRGENDDRDGDQPAPALHAPRHARVDLSEHARRQIRWLRNVELPRDNPECLL